MVYADEVVATDEIPGLSELDGIDTTNAELAMAGQLIDYYARIAEVMVPHVAGRCMTLRRWPDGVGGESFYSKRCPGHRPDWLNTALGPGDRGGEIAFCRLDEPAAVVWAANLAAQELHAPMARCHDLDNPTLLVFDLGPPAALVDCCRVALDLREVLAVVGLEAHPKTSGNKGLQVYVPLNADHRYDQAASFARAVGVLLARQRPDRVLVEMTKRLRAGKVFVDWSQNSRHKTTIAPYSLRGRTEPAVSTPLTWDEVAAGAEGVALGFEPEAVLARVAERGDLFAPTVNTVQHLPGM
jgi:bifunctional non-homologous end joining protein LigD